MLNMLIAIFVCVLIFALIFWYTSSDDSGEIHPSAHRHEAEYPGHYHQQTYAELLQSREWANFRQYIFRIRGTVCEWCHNPYAKPLQVHHKYYLTYRGQRYLPWQYSSDDVMVVCRHCHQVIHQTYDIKTYARRPGSRWR
jgi:predicted HNH restriction endonuclease